MLRKAVILLFFIFLTLGQIPGLLLQVDLGIPFRLHLVDILVGLVAIVVIIQKKNIASIMFPYLEFAAVGLAVTLITAASLENIVFAVRFIFYGLFAVYISSTKVKTTVIETSVLFSITVLTLFGWGQYLLAPDIRWLGTLGWDDHYFRMVSTILDPAFLGIFLVLGIFMALKRKATLLSILFTLTLAFTYSRASWLAFFVGALYFIIKKYEQRLTLLLCSLLLIVIVLLPKPGGEGVNLVRTNSIEQKVENNQQAIMLISNSPVWGWGTGAICHVKNFFEFETGQNSCRGLDNSLLFVMASTGLVGTIFFLRFSYLIFSLKKDRHFTASLIAILVHSLFTNTLFYPFIMGWIAIMLGVQKGFKENNLK